MRINAWPPRQAERPSALLSRGVFNDAAMANDAFFYFSDLRFVDSAPEDRTTESATEESSKAGATEDRIRQECRIGKLKLEPSEDYLVAKFCVPVG